jgi:peptide deformylase
MTMPGDEAILRDKAQKFTGPFEQLEHLAHTLGRLMHAGQGIGLAAPQIGVLKRLIVVSTDIITGKRNTTPDTFLMSNPVLIRKSKATDLQIEGCLSLPGQFGLVYRSLTCLVGFQNHLDQKRRLECTGLLARCVQHEIDHLDGILISDKWVQEVFPRG